MLDLGICQQEFISKYFEKQFYLKRQAVKTGLISWREISELLYSWDAADAQLRIFKSGLIPQEKYIERFQDVEEIRSRLKNNAIEDYMHQGATLVIDRIDRKISKVGELCFELAEFIQEKTVANGYLAFGGDGSFGQHWDTHDVFAIQVIGKKRWTVFRPTLLLPLEGQKYRGYTNHVPETLVFDGVLEAGDLLYIPRGWWHEAIPIPNKETLHLAVGVHTAKTLDYATWLCSNVLPSYLESRRTFKRGTTNVADLQELLQVIAEQILQPDNIREFASCMQTLGNKHSLIELEPALVKAQ